MSDKVFFALLFCASIPLIVLSCSIYRLVSLAKNTARHLEISAQLSADAKVFSVAALCYLKTLYDKKKDDEPTNPAETLILAAEQLATAALVEAGVNARAYNLRTILEAIHMLYSPRE